MQFDSPHGRRVSFAYRSVGHIHKRHTSNLKVLYYVGEQFTEEYSGNNLKNVERSIEGDYISNLRNNCWKERQQSEFTLKHLQQRKVISFLMY